MGEKLPVPAKRNYPELNLHILVADYFRAALDPSVVWFHIPNQMTGRTPRQAAILKRMGVMAGCPDLLLLWRDWPRDDFYALFIELKAPSGRPSRAQTDFYEWTLRAGCHFAICASLDVVDRALKEFHVPMRGRIRA